MASNKDILDAQRFNRRRLISAFTSGMPGGREIELKSPMGPMVIGVIITILVIVAAWIMGRFAPALPENWENGMYITDSDSGANYFSVEGRLHPIRNASSAMLLSGDTALSHASVGASALADIPRGPEIGIPGAPDSVPEPEYLYNDGWIACPADGGVHVTIGMNPSNATGANAALVQLGETAYLVSEGWRYEIAADDVAAVQVAFGWEAAEITPVPTEWADLFDEGSQVGPWSMPGAGESAGDMTGVFAGAQVGTLVEVPDAGSMRHYVVSGEQQLSPLSEVELQLYLIGGAVDMPSPIRASLADIASLTVTPGGPGAPDWPDDIPELNDPALTPCAALVTRDGNSQSIVMAADAPEQAGTVVPGGGGALVRASSGGTLGSVFLVTDLGEAHGLEGDVGDVVQRLGYQMTNVSNVPAPWVRLIEQGPVLSTDAAWSSVPLGDGMTADGTVVGTVPAPMIVEPAPLVGEVEQCEPGVEQFLPQEPEAFGQLGVPRAQQLSTGEGVTVAVVDSGVDATNAHLRDVPAGNDLVGDSDGRTDIEGHGTAIAGQIAADPVDGSGLVGIAPDAKILPVRVYEGTDTSGPGEDPVGPNIPFTAEGIRWAADEGAQVIVVALSTAVDSPELASAVQHAHDKGSLVIASAGNVGTLAEGESATSVRYPAGYETVLGVTAVTDAGAPTDAAVSGVHVGVAAPGQNVLTTWFGDGDCVISPDAPSSSFSTAYVGGVAALVAAAHPDESPDMWKWRLEATALRADLDDRNDQAGWGIVAPYDALTVTPTAEVAGPLMPGGERQPEPAQAGRVPPAVSEDPQAVRSQVAVVVTGAGVLFVSLLWLLRRGRELRRRRS